jgi:LDH2 family malate/lactate/ureidoglycolate dehydrogenase
MVDPDGKPTTDPQYYLNGGALLPVGAHKGYGLSMLVEALSALVSGGNICRDVKSWCFDLPSHNRVCHAFLAVDLAMVCPDGTFEKRAEDYCEYIQNSPLAKETSGIFLPGEMEWDQYDDGIKNGISLPDDVVDSLRRASGAAGIALRWRNDENDQ